VKLGGAIIASSPNTIFKKLIILIGLVVILMIGGRALLNRLMPRDGETLGDKIRYIPIGDHLHTEVYTFIKDFLLAARSWTPDEKRRLISEERKILSSDEVNKPYTATTVEGEMSGLLRLLCTSNANCLSLTLYQRDGVEVARGETPRYHPKLPTSKEDKIEWGKNEINLGTLGLEPLTKLGLTSSTDGHGKTVHELIELIYDNKGHHSAYLAKNTTHPPETPHEIIGYVRYCFQ
jgi:hypothetical protein